MTHLNPTSTQPQTLDKKSLETFADRRWRLNNLYKIVDAQGVEIPFRMNAAQERLFDHMHYFNTILKARQLGFSTFICIYMLDACLFKSNHSAGIIAQGLTEAEDLFKNKVRFAYDRLPDWLKTEITAKTDSARKLEFSNGSSIQVGTSLRGGTFQKLHISEYGKIAARYPEKAREIKTGALNTVHAGQQIFVESTAEGQQGEFFDLCERARKLGEQGAKLTPLDSKLHFYPWYDNPNYVLQDVANVAINQEMREYFTSLPVELTPQQKAWYVKKAEQQGDYMKREYPSTPLEAFEQSMEGAYFTQQMTTVRKNKQIRSVPHEPSSRVVTWWDLGMNDMMTIWFFQHIGNEYRFINYYENNGEGLQHYADYCARLGYVYEEHNFPHDGNVRDLGTGKMRRETAQQLGIYPINVIPVTKSINDDIQALRNVLPRCYFDEENCAQGIKHLDNYRKEWDDKLAVWKDKPRHDAASHGVDPLRNFARHYKKRQQEFIDYQNRQQQAETYDPLEY